MPMIDYNGGGDYEQPNIWTEGQGTTDPTPRAGNDPNAFNTVSGYYQSLLGRAPENNDVVNSWVNGLGAGGSNLSAVQQAIANSPEAQAYKSRAAAPAQTTAPSGGRSMDDGYIAAQVAQWAAMPGADPSLANDPGYWVRRIKETGGLGSDNMQWWQNAGVGATAFVNNPNREQGGAAPGPNPGGYTDPSSMLYLQQLMDRLNQVKQPQDTQVYDLLKSLALQRVDALNAKPYSAADDAALITQYRQPLTQARDQAKQQAALDLSRRGIGPTSGVFQDRMKQIDQAYIGGVAQGANQMGVNAVAQKQQNAQQQLQILSSLLAANNNQYDRTSAQGDKAVDIAKMFPDFDAQRLDQLLRASGDTSGSSALSSLMQLGNLNLNTQGINNSNDAANAAAWGKIIASIIAGLG